MLEIVKNSFSDVNFNINLIMHSLILFTFLSIFFTYYISNLTKHAFADEISHMMESTIGNKVDEYKKDESIKKLAEKLPLENMLKAFSKEDKAVEMHNKGLFNTLFFSNAILWIGLIVTIYILKQNNEIELNIGHIILENAIIFSIIGIVEFMFFKYIALKFIPVEPSFISHEFLNSVKKELKE